MNQRQTETLEQAKRRMQASSDEHERNRRRVLDRVNDDANNLRYLDEFIAYGQMDPLDFGLAIASRLEAADLAWLDMLRLAAANLAGEAIVDLDRRQVERMQRSEAN